MHALKLTSFKLNRFGTQLGWPLLPPKMPIRYKRIPIVLAFSTFKTAFSEASVRVTLLS